MADSVHPLWPLATKLRRLAPLTAADTAAILALPHAMRHVPHLTVLVREGESPRHCTLLLGGTVARERSTRLGGRQLLGFYIRGDLIDLDCALIGSAHDSFQLYGDGEIVQIPAEAILALAAAHPAIGHALWIDTLVDASITREWMLNVGRRNGRTRLLHLFCELAVRQEQAGIGGRDTLILSLTQEQIGDALGLTAVHVNRMFQSLRDEPSIERVGRRIQIRDWAALARLADFDDAYLQVPRAGVRQLAPAP